MAGGKKKTRKKTPRKKVVRKPLGLTAKQQRFVEEYLIDCNATGAALRAGYSARTVDKQGYQLLVKPRISAAIRAGQKRIADKAEIAAVDVLREWGRLATSDLRDVLEVKHDDVCVKPSSEWPDDAARAVAEVVQTKTETGGSIRVKMHAKQPALDSLGKYLGLLIERRKTEHSGPDGKPIQVQRAEDLSSLDDDELLALRDIREKLDAAGGAKPRGD